MRGLRGTVEEALEGGEGGKVYNAAPDCSSFRPFLQKIEMRMDVSIKKYNYVYS